MREDTYYTVLNVKETATPSEIKTAYRDLIKQVHPDTIATLAPYLRRIAEDKAKEITEAYGVLSNSGKRRDYDRQLADYRRQNAPQAPPPPTPTPSAQKATSQTSSSPYCKRCGTSLHTSGFCPCCNKFTGPSSTPPTPKVVRPPRYNWAPLLRWSREHPILALMIPLLFVWLIATLVSSPNTASSESNCSPLQKVEINGRFVCQQSPVQTAQVASVNSSPTAPTTKNWTVVSEEPAPSKPTVSVSGAYLGTVHNRTVNLSSSFVVVLKQKTGGRIEGCAEVKPPLYGSGALRGRVGGAHLDFEVADIRFQGDAAKSSIKGSYVVSRQGGEQVGDFRLTREPAVMESYSCARDGSLVAVQNPPSVAKLQPPAPVHRAPILYAVVAGMYGATLYKRCAFLPIENYGRCNWGPEEVAKLKQGDRVKIVSPLTRAQSGDDIYKVRTQQGWEGWVRDKDIIVEPQ